MQDWVWVIQLLSAVGVAAAAVFAWRSSKAAGKSVEATENTVKAQIVFQITSNYSSAEMGASVKNLHDWESIHGVDSKKEFDEGLRGKGDTDAKRLDGDRRRVAHYFHQIKNLLDCRVIDENFVKKLVKPDQIDTLLDIVEPLAEVKDPDYDHSTFDTFRRIYRGGKNNKES